MPARPNLVGAQSGVAHWDEQRALEHAERERAAADEPVVHADVQAGLEAAASDTKAAADADTDFEI